MDRMYKWLDVKGKDVVDVGANIGDSAIYFALRRAKRLHYGGIKPAIDLERKYNQKCAPFIRKIKILVF